MAGGAVKVKWGRTGRGDRGREEDNCEWVKEEQGLRGPISCHQLGDLRGRQAVRGRVRIRRGEASLRSMWLRQLTLSACATAARVHHWSVSACTTGL